MLHTHYLLKNKIIVKNHNKSQTIYLNLSLVMGKFSLLLKVIKLILKH